MIQCTLHDKATGKRLLNSVRLTATASERMKGLLGSQGLKSNDGLIISPCNSVHTFFMKYSIDVIYLDKEGIIKKIVPALKPWRMSFCFSCASTLELASGEANKIKLILGQQLEWNTIYA
ncbi:MAG: DUF192 domain-containing protein [Gammaproteobacteria bacterium]|nr:DUF192 domain-containing protein [Gammaproteobacteria bacterium]